MTGSRRLVARRRGGPETLALVEESPREPGPDEVRVRVLACGVSFADVLMREGIHPEVLLRRFPVALGWDVAGRVDAVGRDVSDPKPGARVVAMPIMGGCADHVIMRPAELVELPDGVDLAEAACLPLNYVTAWQMLHRTARSRAGQTALVHAAAGGVGTALLELCRLAGVRTFGTASAPKHALVRELGADPVDYRAEDFVDVCRAREPGGLDVVFDGIGGPHLLRSLRVLKPSGRLVAYGFGAAVKEGRRAALLSNVGGWLAALARGMTPGRPGVGVYSIQTRKRLRPGEFRRDLGHLVELLSRGEIRPRIGARLPLSEAARAHELVARGEISGKVVLMTEPEGSWGG